MDACPASETQRLEILPARFRDARDQPCGSKFAKSESRNLEPANKRATTTADLAAIYDPGWTGVARELRKPDVIFLRFELSSERSVFFHRRALAVIAIDPGGFRHKGTRKVAKQTWIASCFCPRKAMRRGAEKGPQSE